MDALLSQEKHNQLDLKETSLHAINKSKQIESSKQNIKIRAQNIDSLKKEIPLLKKKSRSGVVVSILLQEKFSHHPKALELKASGISLRKVRYFKPLPSRPAEQEIWLFDEKYAYIGDSHFSNCFFLSGDGANAFARHFDQEWYRQTNKVSFSVQHKKFFFRSGKGCLDEMRRQICFAKSEVVLFLPPHKVTPLLHTLIEARNDGVTIRLLSNPARSWKWLSWKWSLLKLKKAGVKIAVVARPLPSYILIDKSLFFWSLTKQGNLKQTRETCFAWKDRGLCKKVLQQSGLEA